MEQAGAHPPAAVSSRPSETPRQSRFRIAREAVSAWASAQAVEGRAGGPLSRPTAWPPRPTPGGVVTFRYLTHTLAQLPRVPDSRLRDTHADPISPARAGRMYDLAPLRIRFLLRDTHRAANDGRRMRTPVTPKHRTDPAAVPSPPPSLLWEWDARGECTSVSDGWLTLTGRTREQELGLGWTDGVHPDDLGPLLADRAEAIRFRAPFVSDHRQRTHDERWSWIRSTGMPRLDADGSLLGYLGASFPIEAPPPADASRERLLGTERQARVRAETLQVLGSDLTRALTLRQVVNAIVRHAIPALGARGGGVLELTPAGDEFVVLGITGSTHPVSDPAEEAGYQENRPRIPVVVRPLPLAVARTDTPIFVAHMEDWPQQFDGAPPLLYDGRPAASCAALPLRAGGRVFGVLALNYETPRDFDEDEQTFTRVFAHQCSQALERARLFEAERAARADAEAASARLADVLDSMAGQFYAYDRDWRFIHMNNAARDAVQRLVVDPGDHHIPTAIMGRRLWDLLPFLRGTVYETELTRAMEQRVPVQFEAIDHTQQRWLEIRGFPTAEGIATYVQDVSARHRAEGATRLLVQAGEVLGATLDVDITIAATARLAIPAFADYCAVDLLDRVGTTSTVRRAATAHADPVQSEILAGTRDHPPRLEADSLIARVLRTGTSEFASTTTRAAFGAVSSSAYSRIAASLGPQSHVCVALRARGEILGSLLFVRTQAGGRAPYDSLDVTLAEEIGRRAASAIDAARLYDAETRARTAAGGAARRAALLAEASAALAASVEAGDILQTLVRVAVPELADFSIVYRPNAEGGADRVARAHVHDAGVALIDRLEQDAPVVGGHDGPSSRVLRTVQPMLYPDLTLDDLHAVTRGPYYRDILKQLDPCSLIVVPLAARGRALGALTLAMTSIASGGSDRRYTEDDLATAVSLADRAALALDSALLLADATRARAEAEQASGAKTSFLNVLSHELRTPIGAVLSHAQLIGMEIHGPVTDAQHAALARIQRSAEHLTALVNDLLNLTRIEQGRVNYSLRRIEVRDALDTLVALLSPQAIAHSLTLAVEAPPGLFVRADVERLQQILLNLIGNAIKFTLPGGRITLSAAATDATIDVAIQDTGLGIPPDKLGAIFDRFVQVDQSLTRRAGGIGLGLAIARDLARGMSGDLTVTSEVDAGSTFTLTLPRLGRGDDE